MATVRMHDDEVGIDVDQARRLVERRYPHLTGLSFAAVEPWGTDNALWRVGTDLVVRFPRHPRAAGQAEREARWLPILAPHLPVAIPEPVALGQPDDGYPFDWAVLRWLPGTAAAPGLLSDPVTFALDLAEVMAALRRVPTEGAPPARNRARPPAAYDRSARSMIESASQLIDADAALALWAEAMDADEWSGAPGWVHGDLEFNCLLGESGEPDAGRLVGIVDWASACVGDPAVDLQVMWSTLFTDRSRSAFLEATGADEATVARSRGAAVQQVCGALPYYLDTYPLMVERCWAKAANLGILR